MIKRILNKHSYGLLFTLIGVFVGSGIMLYYKNSEIKDLQSALDSNLDIAVEIGRERNSCKEDLHELKHDYNQLRAIEFNTLVDPSIVKAIIMVESNNEPNAYNAKEGAVGLMQLRPIVYKKICGLDKEEAFDPQKNVACGSLYFKHLLNRFGGNVSAALQFYNSGSPEGTTYIKKVSKKLCKGKKPCQTPLLPNK